MARTKEVSSAQAVLAVPRQPARSPTVSAARSLVCSAVCLPGLGGR